MRLSRTWRYYYSSNHHHIEHVGGRIQSVLMFRFLICQEPSVSLAIQLLDGTPLRPGGKIPMSVSIAKFEQKGNGFSTDYCEIWYLFHPLTSKRWKVIQICYVNEVKMYNETPLDYFWILFTGDAFIAKQMDKKKKKKLKRVEDKILGWGMNFKRLHMVRFTISGWL